MKNAMIHRFGFCLFVCTLGLTSPAAGQSRILENNDCLYGVEGNCVPRRTTYGYYQTHWRTWPFGEAPRIPKLKKKFRSVPKGSTILPDAEVPRTKDESSLNPNLPNRPEELAPDRAVPPSQHEIDRQTDPFHDETSTPNGEAPGLDLPDVDLPDADLLDSDLPGSHMPDVESPFEDDLNIPPAGSSGAIRLDRSGISQRRPMRTMPASAAPAGYINPLRKVPVQNQTTPSRLRRTGPSMRSVSYAAPIHETRRISRQPASATISRRSASATTNSNPLRTR